jgi:hypothetical protein
LLLVGLVGLLCECRALSIYTDSSLTLLFAFIPPLLLRHRE